MFMLDIVIIMSFYIVCVYVSLCISPCPRAVYLNVVFIDNIDAIWPIKQLLNVMIALEILS